MTPTSDPARAFAFIVGVERSSIFDVDPLVGPVADAIACFDWMVARGVPTSRIRMFVSPKGESFGLLDDWEKRRGEAVRAEATEAAIQDFLGTGLQGFAPKDGGGALLLVMWSGHGLIDQRGAERTRRLFYVDSSPGLPRHMEVMALLRALKTRRFAGFTEQVFAIDACASFSGGLFGGQALGPPTNVGQNGAPAVLRQWVMLAASPGQLAQTDKVKLHDAMVPASKFVQRLLERLDGPAASRWPDFRAGFMATRASFEGEDQLPVSWAYGDSDDELTDDGLLLLSRPQMTRLARALQVAGLSTEKQRASYAAALHPLALAESHHLALQQGLPAMVELLGDTADAGVGLPAAQRFALEAAARASHVRGAELLAWLRRSFDDATLERELDRRRAALAKAQAGVCFVLIDESPNGQREEAVDLHAWLFVGKDPVPVLLTDDQEPLVVDRDASRADALGELLGRAYDEAANKGLDAPSLVLEFALPLERIGEDVEAQPYNDGFGTLPVGQCHTVVRRIADRLRALSRSRTAAGRRLLPALAAWRNAASLLRERFERYGLHLVWMDPERVIARLLEHDLKNHPQGSCVGLAMAVEGGRLTQRARDSLFHGAVPFACWSRDAWTDDDTAVFEVDMGDCVDLAALQKIFDLRCRAGFTSHPSTRLAILWDDPARNPYAEQLGAEGA